MRFLALDTDVSKLRKAYCHDGECELHYTRYHGFSFFFAILREISLTIFLLGAGVAGWAFGWPMAWLVPSLFLVWLLFVLYNVLKAYIDWCYDFILVTTDKLVLVDQTSIFHREIKPIHMENIGSVSTQTQLWGIFPFGKLCIHLKEGLGGEDMTLRFVPYAGEVATKISDAVTRYQREH